MELVSFFNVLEYLRSLVFLQLKHGLMSVSVNTLGQLRHKDHMVKPLSLEYTEERLTDISLILNCLG